MLTWLKGLAAAAIGGAASNAAVYTADPSVFAGPALGKRVGIISGIGAATAVIAYLMKSPISAK
jgi:hypothetical protein